jgi:prophage regulatory protein
METILRMRHLRAITGLSRTTILTLEMCGRFPRRRRIGRKAVGWLQSEVEQWVLNRSQLSTGSEKKRC